MNLEGLRPSRWFRTDYVSCRQRFLDAIAMVDEYDVDPLTFDLSLPESAGQFTIDAVYIGEPTATKTLVLISGTHGVEGYAGSAIQSFLAEQLAAEGLALADDLSLVFIHTLNPWGMHWARRCDHEGIDLNRNFIDFKQPLPIDPDYLEIAPLLEIADAAERDKQIDLLMQQWGRSRFNQAFYSGQYSLPWAPFYGGAGPSFSRQSLEKITTHWQLANRELVVIDLHTGLGPWAYGELISDHPSGSPGADYAIDLLGPAVAQTDQGESSSLPMRGLLDYYWHDMMRDKGCFLTLEFGSYSTDALFDVLLNEHQFWRENTAPSLRDADYLLQRTAMLEHFCPRDESWRQAVLFKAWQVVRQVMKQL